MIRSVTAAAIGLAAMTAMTLSSVASPAPPYGVWTSQERDVRVRLHDCSGKICGTLVWLQEAIDPKTGQPKTDKRNPDPTKRARPLIGLQVAKNFVRAGAQRWTGIIYNADDGHTYRARMILLDARTMRLEGCMLVVLCKGHIWRRVEAGVAQGGSAPHTAAGHSFNLGAFLRELL